MSRSTLQKMSAPEVLVTLLALVVAPACLSADDKILDLPLGDPARRDRQAPVVLDGVTDTARGDVITAAELAARLDGVELLFVGESHTDYEFHQVQLRVIEELQRRGRKVLIGLEMYPAGEQAMLDEWSTDPAFTAAEFLAQSRWYNNWGYHWEYYRPIFDFAHRHGLRMFGLNVPRKVVQTARKEGLQALTPEQRDLLPAKIDTDSAEQRRLFRAFFSADGLHGGMSDEMFEGMFTAQCHLGRGDGAQRPEGLSRAMAATAPTPPLPRTARSWRCSSAKGMSPTASAPNARRGSPSPAASPRSSRCGSRTRRPRFPSPRRAPPTPISSGACRGKRRRSIRCWGCRRRSASRASR